MSLQKISLFLLDDFIAVFMAEQTNNQEDIDNLSDVINWQNTPIRGEKTLEHENDTNSLTLVLKEINQRINTQNKLADCDISIIYAHNCLDWLEMAINLLSKKYKCHNLQISKWTDLADYATVNQRIELPNPLTVQWIKDNILPITFVNERLQLHKQVLHEQEVLFAKQKQAQQQAFQSDLEQAQSNYNNETAKLDEEKEKLLKELKDIRMQLATVQAPSLESLVSYLPAIFKDFWNIIPPAELSIIAGKIDTPNIPSPYRSPSNQAVLTKKRQFVKLDNLDQQQIISFCHQLCQQYSLQIHHEFKSIIEEIG